MTLVSSSPITLGGSATDTATLSSGVNPTGSITFTAYGPSDTASCSGAAAFTSVVDVTGNGEYTSAAFTPTGVGVYQWVASYSGDGNNEAASSNCGDEPLEVGGSQGAVITVIKHVISDHGGMKEAKDFMIHVMYYDATNGVWLDLPTSPQAGDESGTLYSGLAPGLYKVSEDAPPPLYVQVSITGDCAADGTVTVEANSNKVCTITNKDPALVVIKHVIGGSKSASDFTITVHGSNVDPATFPGSESSTRVLLDPGPYSVTETPIADYSTTYSADCSGTIVVEGLTKTCIITNEYSGGGGGTNPVGGAVYSVSKLALLAPYLTLLGVLGAATAGFTLRRRHS